MNVSSERMISSIVNEISNDCSLPLEDMRNKLSSVVKNFSVEYSPVNEDNDLPQYVDMFLTSKKLEGLSINTLKSYKIELRIFVKNVKKNVDNISTTDIRFFLSQFSNLKSSSVAKKLFTIKSFFKWLTEEEIVHKNPSSKIKPIREGKSVPKSLSIEQLEMLRESCKTLRQRALLEVFYSTGCRLSEIINMDISDIDFHRRVCNVVSGKGGKDRQVFLSFKATYHLKKYLKTRTDDLDALFVTYRKEYRRVQNRAIQREVKKIAYEAKLNTNIHPHSLRHSFATISLNNNMSISAVQSILGHSSIETTMVYAQLSENKKREEYEKHFVI